MHRDQLTKARQTEDQFIDLCEHIISRATELACGDDVVFRRRLWRLHDQSLFECVVPDAK
jgi:hypothetical protein